MINISSARSPSPLDAIDALIGIHMNQRKEAHVWIKTSKQPIRKELHDAATNSVKVCGQFERLSVFLMTKESDMWYYYLTTVVTLSCLWKKHTGRVRVELCLQSPKFV